jgi:hypothetical protein
LGLLSELLLLPLAPARLAMWTIDKVIDVSGAQRSDSGPPGAGRAESPARRGVDQ